ncbi:MAG: DUF4826 family protein [Flavobacteriaceae bacterium]
MNDKEYEDWNNKLRARTIDYLENEGIKSPEVGTWPAFDIAPYFGIWCVESKIQEGKIGWWVFAGDCPTDYVTESGKCHPREALRDLLTKWGKYIPYMKNGQQPPEVKFGDGSNLEQLGNLLEKRVEIYQDWLEDDGLWPE